MTAVPAPRGLTFLLRRMRRTGGQVGLAALCLNGGLVAMVVDV